MNGKNVLLKNLKRINTQLIGQLLAYSSAGSNYPDGFVGQLFLVWEVFFVECLVESRFKFG